jgi:nicotinate phosphoribosyltransferase
MLSSLQIYNHPLGLLTDLYQLTMAYGYWKLGRGQEEAVFHLSFRQHPFAGGFTLACGLATVVDFVQRFAFTPEDLTYLATLQGHDNQPLFEPAFCRYLQDLRLTCDIDAIPEGTVVFPHEPLVRVKGPLLQCQLLETALLNMVNFPTLVATKAARICQAAKGEGVLEFGLRRAQAMDGALTASRAAYVGGCAATSNVLAGRLFGIPVKGTHAHSWVMCFGDEAEAFAAYAQVMPHNVVLLVDTYDTLQGVRHAVEVGRQLQAQGRKLLGIRLDSGDLAYLSMEARKMLDEAGLNDTAIVASNDLDEQIIMSLKDQGAAINVWGVGTRLATAYDQPALGGVYKLAALRDAGLATTWRHKIKLSEQLVKTSIPGILQVKRFRIGGEYRADMIFDELLLPPPANDGMMVDPMDDTRRRALPPNAQTEELLVPVFRGGQLVYEPPALEAIRARAQVQLASFHSGIKRFVNPHQYPVGLEKNLFELRHRMMLETRGGPV